MQPTAEVASPPLLQMNIEMKRDHLEISSVYTPTGIRGQRQKQVTVVSSTNECFGFEHYQLSAAEITTPPAAAFSAEMCRPRHFYARQLISREAAAESL
jgi:hypothetical protein